MGARGHMGISGCGCGTALAVRARVYAHASAPLNAPALAATPSVSHAAHSHSEGGSKFTTPAGKASDSPEAVRAYRIAQKVIAVFPNKAALERAGYRTDGGGSHYDIPRAVIERIAGEPLPYDMGRWVIDRSTGKTIMAQMDSTYKGATPPPWPGVEWHQHAPGTQWMMHVNVTRPIDQAFVGNGVGAT